MGVLLELIGLGINLEISGSWITGESLIDG